MIYPTMSAQETKGYVPKECVRVTAAEPGMGMVNFADVAVKLVEYDGATFYRLYLSQGEVVQLPDHRLFTTGLLQTSCIVRIKK